MTEAEATQLRGAVEAERERRARTAKPYRYASDGIAFVHDILGVPTTGPANKRIAPYQAEALVTLVNKLFLAMYGPHGLGKTALAAWATLWFGATVEEAKIPTTASAWRQLTLFLWPEIHKWAARANWARLGLDPPPELLTLQATFKPNVTAFAMASDKPALIEGAHAPHGLYVFDEAKAIIRPTWEAAEGAFSSGVWRALAISTPDDSAGAFYDICRRARGYEHWAVRRVTLDEAIAAGRVEPAWVERAKRRWGEDSPVYQAHVLGIFPAQSSTQLVSLAWLEAARELHLAPTGELAAALDVARHGDDDSALAWRDGPRFLGLNGWSGHDTMSTVARAQMSPPLTTGIDVIGQGAGVYDRLMELGYPALPIDFGAAAVEKERFANVRAEAYWLFREALRAGEVDLSQLEQDAYDRLVGELTAMTYEFQSDRKLKLPPKDEFKKKIGHSPDYADAAVMCWYTRPNVMGGIW